MNPRDTWAIVPVKSLTLVKQRLKAVLPLAARRQLMLTMFEDVLATLRQVEHLPVLVVTPDPLVVELAERAGASVLREAASSGHSAAAMAGFARAQAQRVERAFTVPADAPLVTAHEVHELIEAGRQTAGPHVTLVPNHDGDGTNGLLVSPPNLMHPSFGPGSFARHLAAAAALRAECRVLRLPGLALDIDEPSDLVQLMQHKQGDPRYEFLRDQDLEAALETESR